MSKRKLWRAGLIVVLASLAVMGCSKGGGGAVVDLWWFPLWSGVHGEVNGALDAWPKAMGDQFMQQNKGVSKVNVELLSWDTGVQKLDTAVAAGSPPDLCYIDLAWLPKYVNRNMVVPISDYVSQDQLSDFFSSTTDYATYNNKLYAFPILIAPRVLYANKTMLAKMGVDKYLPTDTNRTWTIDQFNKVADKFPIAGANGKKVYAWEFSSQSSDWGYLMWFWNFGATLYSDNETKFALNSQAGRDALTYLQNEVKAKHFRYLGTGEQADNFWAGEVAFGIDLAYTTSKVQDLLKKNMPTGATIPEIEAMQFPRGDGIADARTYSGIGGIPVFNKPKRTADQTKAVVAFAQYLTNTQNVAIVKELGCFPPRKSTGDVFGGDINANIARSMLDHGEDLGRGENTNKIFLNYMSQAIETVFIGKNTPDGALAQLEKQADDVLAGK